MPIPTLDDLLKTEVENLDFSELVPIGWYDAVITKTEVKPGKKAPYINVEATIHDVDWKGRKVWGISSFSEKALTMPGGPANLLQSVKDVIGSIPKLSEREAIAWVAENVRGCAIRVEVDHEEAGNADGSPKKDSSGNQVYRTRIRSYGPASSEFAESIENEASGIDDDLPF